MDLDWQKTVVKVLAAEDLYKEEMIREGIYVPTCSQRGLSYNP